MERQQSKSKVADDADGAVQVRQGGDDARVDAGAVLLLPPEVGDGVTLEDGNKEKDEAGHDGAEHGQVENVVVNALDRDAEKENADGQLRSDHGNAVPNVA